MNAPHTPYEPLVSVIIPCFNQAGYLSEAIESVLTQCYPRREVLVIDDGSTDDTRAVAGRFPDVRLISQENRGLSAARNRGLEESTGELLVFLDADDRLLPGALSAGVTCLREHPECAFAYGQFRFIQADGTPAREIERMASGTDAYIDFLRANRVAMHATVMYRRWVFEQVGPFCTTLDACEDYEMYFRIVRRHPVVEHSALVAEYRRHPASMSSNARVMLESALSVLDAELPHTDGDPRRMAALREGRRRVAGYYAFQIIRGALPPRVSRRTWRRALAQLWWLIRSHPGGLVHLRLWLPSIVENRNTSREEYASA